MAEQGSDEWRQQRAGKFTGSRFNDLLSKQTSKAYQDLIFDIATERISGIPAEIPKGLALAWGKDMESTARTAYEFATGNVVDIAEFIQHPELPFVGCSPDGLIGKDGGLELKCPKVSRVHLERFIHGVPHEYVPQIQGCMWVTGREWWDFASYDPRMPPAQRLLIITVPRDAVFIQKLEAAAIEAEAKVLAIMQSIKEVA